MEIYFCNMLLFFLYELVRVTFLHQNYSSNPKDASLDKPLLDRVQGNLLAIRICDNALAKPYPRPVGEKG
jgi:hypothetical protein